MIKFCEAFRLISHAIAELYMRGDTVKMYQNGQESSGRIARKFDAVADYPKQQHSSIHTDQARHLIHQIEGGPDHFKLRCIP